MRRFALPLILTAALGACQAQTTGAEVGRAAPAAIEPAAVVAPEGGCWATDTVPAVTETVFDTVAGSAERRAREVVRQPAEERMFAVPCPEALTGDVLASLQRALAARGLYTGPVTGTMDSATMEAVRLYQAPQGLDSGVLSLQAAQQMGLIAVARAAL